MRRSCYLLSGALLALTAAPWGPGYANDTTAAVGAGGLEFRTTDAISMESEALTISPEAVGVAYVFRNAGSVDVDTEVAFPMPDLDYPMLWQTPVVFPEREAENFVGFTVEADGKKVTPSLESKAFKDGRDVTADLLRLGIPPAIFPPPSEGSEELHEIYSKLPPAAQAEAKRLKLVDEDGMYPLWTLKTTYHWRQVFPAGATVKIAHRYRPVAGMRYVSSDDFGPQSEAGAIDFARTYCVDAKTGAALNRVLKAKPPAGYGRSYLAATTVDYVLKTGANWAGPIRHFTLTLDKGAGGSGPGHFVTACIDGLRKVSPTRFEVRRENFTPTGNLRVLFLAPVPAIP